MYVCLCRSVTESDIHTAVDEGVASFDQLQKRTGCSTECGCCAEFADQVLFEALREKGNFLRLVVNGD